MGNESAMNVAEDLLPIETDECQISRPTGVAGARAQPGRRRWVITFVVIAMLLTALSVISIVGLVQSDWFHPSYSTDPLDKDKWDQIANLRERLIQLGTAPEAVAALNDVLVLPHPTAEEVVANLRKATFVLDQLDMTAAREIQIAIQTLIVEITRGDYAPPPDRLSPGPKPTPTPKIEMGAPVA